MKRKKGFSVVEMSVILLIFGIILAGVIQGGFISEWNNELKMRRQTLDSPVRNMTGLEVWYETTLENSLIETERSNGEPISRWNDVKSSINGPLNNATQTTQDSRPIYVKDAFGKGVPGLRFDGNDDYLNFDGSFLAGNDYTIFIVERRGDSNNSHQTLISGTNQSSPNTLNHGYITTNFYFSHYDNNLTIAESNFTRGVTYIHTFRLSQVTGREIYTNGGDSADASSSHTTPLASYSGANIGGNGPPTKYKGDIAEVIIFSKALSTTDRQLVETYLGNKYNITIQ